MQWHQLDWLIETSGTAGLTRVRAGFRPRLAIVNLQLPDMCGTELVERLRKGMPNLPVVVTSNSAGDLAERVARSLGVIAFLAKPVDATLLDQVLTWALRDSGVVREQTVESDSVGGE